MALRLALVDDHKILLESLRSVLEQQPEVLWVRAFSSPVNFLRTIDEEVNYDLLITDLQMPEMHGLELIGQLRDRRLKLPVLVMSMLDNREVVQTALRLGVKGICPKQGDFSTLWQAVTAVAGGGTWFSREVSEMTEEQAEADHNLSPREMDILRGIARGKTSKEIADDLFISPFTVQTHRKNILKKLQLESTAELLQFAVKKGLI